MSGTYNRGHLLFMKSIVNRYEHRAVALCILLLCLSAGAMSGCSTLPPLENRTLSTVVFDTGTTRLGKAITPLVEAHPGKSGLYPLPDARDAFAARSLLARAAERTLDLQYYIWHGDMSGTLLFEEVRRAANRGVRVRLLLDDHGTTRIDGILSALDSHPNIEVRLFNPFVIRTPRAVNYVFDFFRLNRRMHNKSFTADSQVTIIGGRNVGDEYFGAADARLYIDPRRHGCRPGRQQGCLMISIVTGPAVRPIRLPGYCPRSVPLRSRRSHRLRR